MLIAFVIARIDCCCFYAVEMFLTNIVAALMGYRLKKMVEISSGERKGKG